MRVIQTSPSFFGKPWIHPRASAKSWSTQMNGQVVTSSSPSIALTTMKNSLVLRARRVEQLVAGLRARLPVGEDRGAAAGVRVRLQPLGQHRAHRVRVGPVVDDEEVADVVPRRRRDEARSARRGARDRCSPSGSCVSASTGRRAGAEHLEALALGGDRGRRRSGSTSAAAAGPTCSTSSGRRARRAARARARAAPCRSRARRSTPPRRCARRTRCCRRRRAASGPSRASGRGGRDGRARSRIWPMSTTSKARWWKCGVALVDQRHHVVVARRRGTRRRRRRASRSRRMPSTSRVERRPARGSRR